MKSAIWEISATASAAANERVEELVPEDLPSFLSQNRDQLRPESKANLQVFQIKHKNGGWEEVFGKKPTHRRAVHGLSLQPLR